MVGAKSDRKPLLEHKAVQSIMPLTEDKHKFREWNVKFVNTMAHLSQEPHRISLLSLATQTQCLGLPPHLPTS